MQKNKKQKFINTYNVIFHEEDDDGYSVSVPSLPGCFSQGDNFDDAIKNIKEAIELYLEDKTVEEVRSKREFMVPLTLSLRYA